ncbi:MAG TPA: amidase [Azospirillaceae bacterium]|nr:amidase [Azospirillaceae bacterium]
MTDTPDPTALSASSLSEALARGTTTAEEAARAYLDRIAALDGELGCYITVCAETALAEAVASDQRRAAGDALGPLDGVPVAVKDNIDAAGVPCTGGVAAYRHRVPQHDAFCVERLREAGAVILGKLNLHEGALGATNENPAFGRCHNPHRRGHTPGGSSGGSAAAVAARLCAAALGTDTLGSIRIPAAYCGVAGLKPTYGLVSTAGLLGLSWTLDHVGPLARTVQDLALLADTLVWFDPAWPDSRPAPPGWSAAIGAERRARPLAGLRVGRPDVVERVACEPAVLDAYAAALEVLRALGAEIVPTAIPGWDPGPTRRAGFLVVEAEGAMAHEAALARDPGGFSPAFRALLEYGRDVPGVRLAKAYRRIADAAHAVDTAFGLGGERLDALVLPTTPQAAFPFDAEAPDSQGDFTAIANFTGRPAVSVPMGLTPDGLPLGLQLIGHHSGEQALLRLAAAFEKAAGVAVPDVSVPG